MSESGVIVCPSHDISRNDTSDAFCVLFGACAEVGIGDPRAGGVTVAGGGVRDILVVGDGTSGGGEECSIGL